MPIRQKPVRPSRPARPEPGGPGGCAGLYTAHAGIELYAEAFDRAGALDALEAFASRNGPAFYGLEPNRETIMLRRDPWPVPREMPMGGDVLVPFRGGSQVQWRLVA